MAPPLWPSLTWCVKEQLSTTYGVTQNFLLKGNLYVVLATSWLFALLAMIPVWFGSIRLYLYFVCYDHNCLQKPRAWAPRNNGKNKRALWTGRNQKDEPHTQQLRSQRYLVRDRGEERSGNEGGGGERGEERRGALHRLHLNNLTHSRSFRWE